MTITFHRSLYPLINVMHGLQSILKAFTTMLPLLNTIENVSRTVFREEGVEQGGHLTPLLTKILPPLQFLIINY